MMVAFKMTEKAQLEGYTAVKYQNKNSSEKAAASNRKHGDVEEGTSACSAHVFNVFIQIFNSFIFFGNENHTVSKCFVTIRSDKINSSTGDIWRKNGPSSCILYFAVFPNIPEQPGMLCPGEDSK